jgi:hypothetical protein
LRGRLLGKWQADGVACNSFCIAHKIVLPEPDCGV